MAEQNVAVEVVVSWDGNPLDTTVVREGALRIGAGGWFEIPAMTSSHELVGRDERGWILSAPSGAEMMVAKSGKRIEASEPTVRLEPAMTAEIKLAGFSFFVRTTDSAIEKLPAAGYEWRWTKWLGVAAVLHAAVLGIFALSPRDASALNIDPSANDTRYLTIALDANARQPEPPVRTPSDQPAGDPGDGSSAPAGSEGGGESPRVVEGSSPAPRRAGRNQPTFVPSATTINRLGTIAALTRMSWGDDSSPFTAGNGREGNGGMNDMASLLLMPAGPGWGALNMNSVGHGTCDPRRQDCSLGIIGVNNLQTLDPGNGGNVPGLRDRGPGRTPGGITMLTAEPTGTLSREEVRRTVRRHINEVRFCYEQALQRRPDVEGRVAVTFIITPSGSVQSVSSSSTVSDSQVGSCVETAVRRWTFPESPGVTGVTYPFAMQSAE